MAGGPLTGCMRISWRKEGNWHYSEDRGRASRRGRTDRLKRGLPATVGVPEAEANVAAGHARVPGLEGASVVHAVGTDRIDHDPIFQAPVAQRLAVEGVERRL